MYITTVTLEGIVLDTPTYSATNQLIFFLAEFPGINATLKVLFSGEITKDLAQHLHKGGEVLVIGTIEGDKNNDYILIGKDISYHKQTDQQTWTTKSAYEANKESDKCVVCGKTLNLHPSVGVKYCSCVENLH